MDSTDSPSSFSGNRHKSLPKYGGIKREICSCPDSNSRVRSMTISLIWSTSRSGRDGKQRVARRFTHGKMLADAKQIGKMQSRMERRLRMRLDIFAQHIDLRQLNGPVDGVFQIAEVNL